MRENEIEMLNNLEGWKAHYFINKKKKGNQKLQEKQKVTVKCTGFNRKQFNLWHQLEPALGYCKNRGNPFALLLGSFPCGWPRVRRAAQQNRRCSPSI